jgi:transcriptional antiterminator NusG
LSDEAATRRAVERAAAANAAAGISTSEDDADIPPRDWYILKVQSNREDSIRDALLRRIAIAGYEKYFGDIIVPIEKVSEFKNGKKRTVKRKLYPGYIVVSMSITEDTWFLVRETTGIGDFTGAGGKPSPMLAHEISKILAKLDEKTDEAPKLKISFVHGDRVKIKEGTFENFEGEVDTVDEANGRVTVMINIFGRSTPVELEYWQIEAI